MAFGQPIQVMDPLLAIPSTLKRIFSTSTTFSSYGLCSKTNTTNGAHHIINGDLRRIVENICPFFLETYDRLLDAFQPVQGLFDHCGSGPSDHALHGQGDLFQFSSDFGLRHPQNQNEN